ncbi:uncharacterized protein BDR25DRAFT_395768 [Lindgomyces ingoldianus]|uniref:Uncharacterized protein n=1 Tax=Lindgomyces ingoldianus TaxID=673940 RepID=A0ACB6QJC8_9PLEO|nr:uncharacterized protein BDR25DRAFT_395768 [Lindgomyces ingoldianus]KAF2466237.1 hypothetical protein BDR25DRAFT_395768 [Lindgomyces ingoldianus]
MRKTPKIAHLAPPRNATYSRSVTSTEKQRWKLGKGGTKRQGYGTETNLPSKKVPSYVLNARDNTGAPPFVTTKKREEEQKHQDPLSRSLCPIFLYYPKRPNPALSALKSRFPCAPYRAHMWETWVAIIRRRDAEVRVLKRKEGDGGVWEGDLIGQWMEEIGDGGN